MCIEAIWPQINLSTTGALTPKLYKKNNIIDRVYRYVPGVLFGDPRTAAEGVYHQDQRSEGMEDVNEVLVLEQVDIRVQAETEDASEQQDR